ncbi:Alpha-ketoglutarate-dependent dioxygenase alkB-like protein 2 [Quillaja saponaria]|uniref:Alpha-ketoglutarate-dependent dioxygenase alkB-like protein 2 n=1 Tax=Quillaja saponaria TaxID=32244 RepID=A0AAD7LET7_QUISA|nr:Alpha-ketoglutarate-dependent dioxygenase alkB-like protein 2 [Quillaja saponaria]
MERSTPVRKPHTSTADLLTWSEITPTDFPATVSGPASYNFSGARSHQPSDRISKLLHGGQVTDEEAENLLKKKPCSGYKLREITGSGIFADNGEDSASESTVPNPNNKTGVRVYQQAVSGISQISFGAEESITPKKPDSLPEVAKQRELSGTLQSESDAKKKQISNAKSDELSGHDIFGPPPEIVPHSRAAAHTLESKESKDMGEPAPRNVCNSVKVSNHAGGHSNILFGEEPVTKTAKKINDQKFAELTGNGIFTGDVPPGSAEKPPSRAKLREMSGSDIFADGKTESRDYRGGVRKPPGGGSTIALI